MMGVIVTLVFTPAYFVQLGLSHEEAGELHHHYYKTYGLALRGLVKHHDVGEPIPEATRLVLLTYPRHPDALDFNEKCDGSLQLEDMIDADPSVRELFQDIDRSKARVWALTNAYKTVGVGNNWRSTSRSLHFSPACRARPKDPQR